MVYHGNSSIITATGLENFELRQIFDCGQCFRFDPSPDGGVEGVAFGRFVRFEQPSPDSLIVYGSDEADFERIWIPFLALDSDYSAVKADILSHFAPYDAGGTIGAAMEYGDGIRILRQEPWEALCSFIISQNNNIPRIKKLVAALSERYGERAVCNCAVGTDSDKPRYAFPTPEALADAGEEAIFALKTGFRAKYIYDAARRVSSGETDLAAIAALPTPEAMGELMKIKGVGVKVANCALLYGFGRTDAFPVDVWVKRILGKYYPDGLDIAALGSYAGIAQQYLFYYERYRSIAS